ncbi:hypothetical protein FHR99_001463 [Litorivivens lipolytica]|uniref:Peptidase C14 caspase domain-containing protein n=1 Tax=Litorivivens lipolytica TaxID=1524264 RepID=A0A7W4W4E5_9GAMM|nr:caspase family protein [Litorivivens lipolytica]MBB3047227.1 hypothetical protein [Litorivivens lipolytica]
MRTIILISLILALVPSVSLANEFERYKQQQAEAFKAQREGRVEKPEDKESDTERSGNPCDRNTGYGCKRTVRDQQLNDIMDEDDSNFSSASDDSEDSSSSEDEDTGERSGNPCDRNTGYGCTRTVRDQQLNDIMDEDDSNFSSASDDSEDSSSSEDEDTGERSSNPCDRNTGYGCKRTVRDQQLNDIMDEDDSNFSSGSTDANEDTSQQEDTSTDRSGLNGLQGRNYALIIGINDYEHFKPLNTAVADAIAVSQTLASQYNFETRVLLDKEASRETILGALNEARKSLTPQDNLLIYYAGHGQFIESTDASYWLPYNARKDDNTQWLESKAITDHLKLISARSILVVADSCFSGTITRSADTSLEGADTRARYIQKMKSRPSRVLISSGGKEPVKDGGGGSHSVFANAFLKAMNETSESIFTANELFSRGIREPVAGNAEQIPEYKVIRNSGHSGGDFVFFRAQ